VLTVLASGVAAIALLGAGTALGDFLARGRATTAGGGTQAGRTAGSAQPGARPLPFGPPPGFNVPPNGKPEVVVNQPQGDGYTTFVVIGAGFRPGQPITIRLAGVGPSPYHPRADKIGLFNYVINEAGEFFPGPIPPGRYRVVVTTRDGIRRVASFTVNPGLPGPGRG